MSNGIVLDFADETRRRDAARLLARAQEEGLRLLFPAVERMREMGLSNAEIGRLFKFVGGAFCASEAAEG
jgi:hypothetical protein